jgi:hypothetical protein
MKEKTEEKLSGFPFLLVKFSVRCIYSFEHGSRSGMAVQNSQAATWGSAFLGLTHFTTSLSFLIMLKENNFCPFFIHVITIRW